MSDAKRAAGADLMRAIRLATVRIDEIRAVTNEHEFGDFVRNIITSEPGDKDSTILGFAVICLNALDSDAYQTFLQASEVDLPDAMTPVPADQVRLGDEVRVVSTDDGPRLARVVQEPSTQDGFVTLELEYGSLTLERQTVLFVVRGS